MKIAITRYGRIHWKFGKKKGQIYSLAWYYRAIEDIPKLWRKTFWKPIYYTVWSRDCDMCESTNSGIVYGGEKWWKKMLEEAGEWADGPMHFDKISKGEYENFVAPRVRDRILEAYENGNGSSIYV
jgi:hypothetical protein